MVNPMDLTGKRILITGATGGIGRAVALQLAALGAAVIVQGRSREKLDALLQELGEGDHAAYSIDLQQPGTIEPVIKQICDEKGTLDGLVYCAGIAPLRPLKFTKTEDILQVMQINYFSFMETVRCLIQKKRFADGGSMVAMSSFGSIHGKPTKSAYSASKAAIDASIRCMACDLKGRGIRINSVAPGWVNTAMYQSYMKAYPDSKEAQKIAEKQFLGVIEPLEVANVIAFLLSDATRTITGTTIVMDGGSSQG